MIFSATVFHFYPRVHRQHPQLAQQLIHVERVKEYVKLDQKLVDVCLVLNVPLVYVDQISTITVLRVKLNLIVALQF